MYDDKEKLCSCKVNVTYFQTRVFGEKYMNCSIITKTRDNKHTAHYSGHYKIMPNVFQFLKVMHATDLTSNRCLQHFMSINKPYDNLILRITRKLHFIITKAKISLCFNPAKKSQLTFRYRASSI